MANKTIDMGKIRQILRLYVQGTGKKQISKITGISRNTIKRYLYKFISLKLTYADIDSKSDHELEELFVETKPVVKKDERYEYLQALLPGYEKQLKRKGVTRLQLYEAYRSAQPDGYKNSQFNYFIRQYIDRGHPVMHLEHKAGDKLFIDFAGDKLSVVDNTTGEITEVEVFVATLGCSQLTYVEAVKNQTKEELIKACENAFYYFGGVPAAIVPDNLKSAVTKSDRYEPKINEAFASFAEHYSVSVIPARAYRPKDKALVEGAVKLIYRTIYVPINKSIHTSLSELNTAIKPLLELHNNAFFKNRDYSRRQQFEELEKATLQPLATYRYQIKHQALVTVMKNGHVCLRIDKHYYSVPYRFIGQRVKLLYTSDTLEIYHRYERIAVHVRHMQKHRYTTRAEHLASAHRYLSEWTPEKFRQQAMSVHSDVADYIAKVIETKPHPEQAYKSCSGILSLVRKVGEERLTNACRRADEYGIYNYPIIVEILAKKLDLPDNNAAPPEDDRMPQHDNIRGREYYQ